MYKLFLSALKGVGAFRFYLQPLMAVIRGIRHGMRDANENVTPIVTRLLSGKEKLSTLKTSVKDVLPVIIIALILDLYAQWQIFHYIYFFLTILVVIHIVYLPYIITRDLTNRIKS